MELKQRSWNVGLLKSEVLIVPLWNWNKNKSLMQNWGKGSNRTFMELKLRLLQSVQKRYGVLIVPLWNWNTNQVMLCVHKDWVLIVPLWNWNSASTHERALSGSSSNRTFMELKHLLISSIPTDERVLIVPLWNWNEVKNPKTPAQMGVLIVPLWNWNVISRVGFFVSHRSNRTFMELKQSNHWKIRIRTFVLIVPLWNWNSDIVTLSWWPSSSF